MWEPRRFHDISWNVLMFRSQVDQVVLVAIQEGNAFAGSKLHHLPWCPHILFSHSTKQDFDEGCQLAQVAPIPKAGLIAK